MMEDIDDEKTDASLALKSGIPRPTSRPSSRPLSRPTPSARVRALGKDDLDDTTEQNSVEEEEEEEEEDDEEDEEQGIQVEGHLYPVSNAPSFVSRHINRSPSPPHSTHRMFQRRKLRLSPTFQDMWANYHDDISLADWSIDDELLYDSYKSLEDQRDLLYQDLPFDEQSAYDPADFEHLAVSNDMKELFQYITRYTPQTIELDHKLRPFIPEYIPAVGDIDAFIKVPRPDTEHDKLGLVALDEPCAKQSDPTVLDLQLRAISKETTSKAVSVKKLDSADKRPKEIDAWIMSISNLHQSKPPPTVHYARNMPDVDELMQEWPADVEERLNQVGLPTADLDCSLEEYVDIICGILDIPVYKSRIQSLHVLFSLYMEFKNSPHFKALARNEEIDDFIDDDDGGSDSESEE